MKYEKPSLSIDQQVDLLHSRGMTGDKEFMKRSLSFVNYYRLSGYWFPFRNTDDTFKQGTAFETIWQRYVFDRHLRLLVMDAIERIEIAVRTQLAYHHSQQHGTFGYTQAEALPKFSTTKLDSFLSRVEEETARSKEIFIDHFKQKYGQQHVYMPVWMATELLSLGTVLTFFRGVSHSVKKAIAASLQLPWPVLDSWLLTLNTVRNICAHHGRLWNRELGIRPLIPRRKEYPHWHAPVEIDGKRVFSVLTICRYCLRSIAPQSRWPERLTSLLDAYPAVPRQSMGFPECWQTSPLWASETVTRPSTS